MRVFVIGATGYIGSVVAERFQDAGHCLVGLGRSAQARSVLTGRGIEAVAGSLADTKLIAEQAATCDAVVQIATGGYLTELNADAGAQLRAVADAVITAYAETGKPYVFTNGTGAYGDTGVVDTERLVTEEDPLAPWYFYAHLPVLVDHMHSAAAAADVRLVELRAGQLYGRQGGYIGPIARRFRGLRESGVVRVVRGRATFSYVDVDDLADAYLLALQNPDAVGAFNVVQDDVSMEDLCAAVAAFGEPGCLLDTDLVEVRAKEGWFAAVDFAASVRASSAKARQVLGWDPHRPGLLAHLALLRRTSCAAEVYPGPKSSGVVPSVVPGERHS
jgi:nucleoside-diphosphate-sugar epimerase